MVLDECQRPEPSEYQLSLPPADFTHVFKFKDGKVAGFQQYTDTAQFKGVVAHRAGA
jgi:hypothetical protein